MTHDGSKHFSSYTADSNLISNGLFPNLREGTSTDDRASAASSDVETIDQPTTKRFSVLSNDSEPSLRNNLFRRRSFNKDAPMSGIPQSHSSASSDEVDITDQRPFSSNFDTDSENDPTDTHTLRSSIIEEINDNDLVNQGSRFKFLDAYTKVNDKRKLKLQQKEKLDIMTKIKNNDEIPLQVMKSHDSSLFDLSKLDDFNKYVKMTEINDRIYSKYRQKLPDDDNLLDVIKPTDLEQNFYVDDRLENRSKSTAGIPSSSRHWYNIDWKKNDATVKDNEIFYKSESPSSSKGSFNKNNSRYLSRSLKVRHLQMISFGGTLGVGLFLNSGKALTIAGGFGSLLAFIICGIIVLATIVSFCEMVTFISVVDGVSGLSSRFVDDAFGFAVGWLYFLSFAFGLAGEMVASVVMLTYYDELKLLQSKGSIAGFVTLFLLSVILSNSFNVVIFGEIEYISSFIKLAFILIMIILMIILNRGGLGNEVIGFKYWNYSESDFEHNIIFGLFRPSFNLLSTGMDDPNEGTTGNLGRFMSLMAAIMVVSFAYSGTEIVCIAACEAKDPRKALPSATKRVFWRILLFYCLSVFVVSLNLYAGDPRLLRYLSGSTGVDIEDFQNNYAIQYVGGSQCRSQSAVYAGYSSGSQSPWIVAFQSANLCNLSSVTNAFLVFFAISCGNSQLYVSSRTMYSMSLQGKAPKIFSKCNRYGIPYWSVLFASSFGLLSYICVSEKATTVFQNLANIIASSGIIVWFAMSLSFVRFYYGLQKRPDIISRDDAAYPYKSLFQPYTAFVGLIGSGLIILGMGFVVFLKDNWDTLSFFTNYGTIIVFVICYVCYRFIYGTRTPSLETLDFDSGRRETDRYIWDGNKDYNMRNAREVIHKFASFLA